MLNQKYFNKLRRLEMSKIYQIGVFKCCKCEESFEKEQMSNHSYCKRCYRDYMRIYMRKRREQNK